jgi:membrane protein required for colicin V production
MNLLDIFIIVPLVWFGYKGVRRGLVLELASLAGLILGIYAAIHFSHFTEEFLSDTFELTGKYMPIVSFIVTLIVVILVIYLLGKIVEKLIDMVALGFFNKLLGLAFGILKGALLVSVVLFIINSFDLNQRFLKPHVKEKSLLYAPVEKIVPGIMPWLDLDKFRQKNEEIEEEVLPQV